MGLFNPSRMGYAHRPLFENGSCKKETKCSLAIKEFFEKHYYSRLVLLLVVLLGTSLVIGDGILTPTMSGMFCMDSRKLMDSWSYSQFMIDMIFYVLLSCVVLQSYLQSPA